MPGMGQLWRRNQGRCTGFGRGEHRVLVVVWGPDIGVWLPGPDGRAQASLDTAVGFRRPGKEYRFWSPDQKAAVQALTRSGKTHSAACAIVCRAFKDLLGAVPDWARRELLSWIPVEPFSDRPGLADMSVMESTEEGVILRVRQRESRYEKGRATNAARVLYWGGPGAVKHLRDAPGWIGLGNALISLGKASVLQDIPKGMRTVLHRAFPGANPGTLNALARAFMEDPPNHAKMVVQLNLKAWGPIGQHGLLTVSIAETDPRLAEDLPVSYGVGRLRQKMIQAIRDRREINLHKVPLAEMWRNFGRLVANHSCVQIGDGEHSRVWRYQDLPEERRADLPDLLADALYIGMLLDGGAELARMRSWRRVDEYHRRAGQRLGLAVAQVQGDRPFPALPLAVVQGLRSAPGLEVQHLQNGAQLLVEGGRMRHCIASYSKMALEGQVALFHLRFSPAGQKEVEEASLMLGWKTAWTAVSTLGDEDIEPAAVQWSIFQLYGVKNQLVSKALAAAVVEAFDFDLPRGYWVRGLPPTPTVAAKIPLDGACSDRESRELHLVTHSGFLVREMEIVEVPQGPRAIDRILEGPRIFEGRRTHPRLPKTLSRLLTVAKHHPAERIYDVGVLAAPGIARDAGQTRHEWCPRPVRVL